MNNKKAMMMAIFPILLILLLGVGLRFLERPDDGDDIKHKAEQERRLLRLPRPGTVPNQGTAPAESETPPAPADTATQKAIETAVRGQIAAIAKRDYSRSLEFAQVSMRSLWTPDQFKTMIEAQFQPLRSARTVKAKQAIVRGESSVVEITVIGQEQEAAQYRYVLQREGGKWYIGAVTPLIPQPWPLSKESPTPL